MQAVGNQNSFRLKLLIVVYLHLWAFVGHTRAIEKDEWVRERRDKQSALIHEFKHPLWVSELSQAVAAL